MSSEDVIELGSSDEETEPAPKRSKPMPNAMVCIPGKLHDVTVKPAKANPSSKPAKLNPSSKPAKLNPNSIARGLGKAITVKKVVNDKPPIVIKPKLNNGRPVQQLKPKFNINPFCDNKVGLVIQNKPNSSKVPLAIKKAGFVKQSTFLQKPVKILNSGALNLLPPNITVKKTVSARQIVMLNVKSREQVNQQSKQTVNDRTDVLTVELDDDETPPNKSSPQWYVRPEDQSETSVLEEENNKEPETTNLIEITIEDSPVKPIINKMTHAVGAELSIIIDDSPVKAVADKNKSASESDNEYDSSERKIPHSKKQLVYPKDNENNKTLEIEIDPVEISINNISDLKNDKEDKVVSLIDDDKQNSNDNNKDKNNKDEIDEKSTQNKSDPSTSKENKVDIQNSHSEFTPVYQSFIDLCFELENSDDMKTIVEKKIKGYYKQVPKEYTESEEFTEMVSSKMISMKAGPEKMYLYIKDVVDELNLQRKLAKAQPVVKEIKNEEPVDEQGEEREYDSKRQRQIRKLEKAIKKLHRAIQKLEEQEVDFDDEDDSVYLLTERYKERMVRVYAKFCQLSNTKMPSEPRVLIDARPGQPTGPAKRLEKWINKKVPIGTPLPFPDFHDVLRCVREANEEDKLNFNEVDIMEEARDLFTRCGKKLQRRRQENEWRLAASRIALDIDPAEKSEDLKRKLNENRKIAAQKETDIFKKYADRQNQLQLEGEEIGDKEAEESPVESEEEESNDDSTSLENTEKRKERLKRLLQEKSKKTSEEKENQTSNEKESSETIVKVDTASILEPDDKESEKQEEEKIKENVEDSKKDEAQNPTETFTLSDDSNELESDIDELHLLQKLHSGNEEQSSTVDSSDSESPIDISDSLESNENDKKGINEEIFSIENSSYSENEGDTFEEAQVPGSVQCINKDSTPSQNAETDAVIDESVMEVDFSTAEVSQSAVQAPVRTNNEEYNEDVENILLATSEEDSQEGSTEAPCINLRDDLISIDETVIGNPTNDVSKEKEKVPNMSLIDNENNSVEINLDEKVLSISSTDNNSENNGVEVNIDINVMPSNCSEIKEKPGEKRIEFQADTVKNTESVAVDVVSKQPIEIMDIDQDDNNESEILSNTDKNILATPSLEES